MVRKNAADGLVEAAADGAFGNLEVRPGFRSARVQFFERLFDEVQRGRRSVRLEVSAGTIALDGIAPLGNLPFELDFGKRHGFRQDRF